MSLEELLAAWATQIALPDEAAARIRERILTLAPARPEAATPPGLPAGWWVHHNKQLANLIVQSTRRVRPRWAA